MDLASVVAALASVGVRVSGSNPNNNIQGDSSRACPTGLAGPEPSGTHNDPGQHFQIAGAVIRLHDHPAISPGDTRALSVDQLTPSHPDVRWHSADLNVGWLSPTRYYWIPEASGHTSSDALGGGPCKHATSVALAADLTRTWAVAISGTVPDGEGVAPSLPLQYGAHRPWVHTVDAEVILHLLRHADRERTTGVPAGAAKVVNKMPLRWLRDGLCARGRHAGHPLWYVRATSHHSDALLHKADWAASQDTILQNTPPDPGHAQLIVAGRDGQLDLRPPTMRTLGEVAQRAQTDHALTHRGHTPLGAAHATAYVHARDLTATATNRRTKLPFIPGLKLFAILRPLPNIKRLFRRWALRALQQPIGS